MTAPSHDTHDEDLANGIRNCLTVDGQVTATADLDCDGEIVTNVSKGTSRTDYTIGAQVWGGMVNSSTGTSPSPRWAGGSGGSASAYTITAKPSPVSYSAGQIFMFVANATNTAGATLDVNGIDAKTISKMGAPSLSNGDIQSGAFCIVCYNPSGSGTFQLLNPTD